MDRVTNIAWKTDSGVSLGGFAYGYDALGRVVSRSHSLGGESFDSVYSYDDRDRLASDGDVAYTYDAAGNRMTRTEDGAATTYALGAGDRLASWTGGAYSYDVAGNVTRIVRDGRPTLDLTWNGRYQLVSVSTNGVFAEGYAYDAIGRRVSTTTVEGTTRHVYDNNWQVIADIDEQGDVVASYTWGEGIDRLLAVRIEGANYYPLTDMQGTVWGCVDSANNVVARWQYDAWGNVVGEEVSVAALAALRYRFQGREWSAATGLVHFRNRWYDGETGRWLSKDPIRLSGGLNLYVFCGNDPVNCADSLGLKKDNKKSGGSRGGSGGGNGDGGGSTPGDTTLGDTDRPFFDKYEDIAGPLLINPVSLLPLSPIGIMPKSWAPSTGGRPPALGSKNPWTSIPRGLGFDRGGLRPLLRSAGFRATSYACGVTLLGVGMWNAGVAVGAAIGATYSD